MADERKRFIVETIYINKGLKEYSRDLSLVQGLSKNFSTSLSKDALLLEQNLTESFDKSGNKIVKTTATVLDQGQKMKISFKATKDGIKDLSQSFVEQGAKVTSIVQPLRKLEKELTTLTSLNKGFSRQFGKEFQKATYVVEQLPAALSQKRIQFDGKEVIVPVQKLSTVVATADGRLKQLNQTITTLPNGMKRIDRSAKDVTSSFKGLRDSSDKLSNVTKRNNGLFSQYGDTFKKLLIRAPLVIGVWALLRNTIQGVSKVVRESIKFLIDWEYQMAQIRLVSNDSNETLNSLSNSLLNLSKSLGISNKDLGEGAKLYVQQGRSIKEIIPLMDATAKLSLLTGRSITQSVEDMTAVLKAYKLEAQDATNIVNEITNVMLNHAITAGDLAQAYKATASTASSLGLSLEALTGYITAIKSETRDSGSKVGLSIRTMLSRITTSSVEALQQITQVPFYIDEMGKATTNVTPNLRNLETVITEIASKFDQLGTAQQSQVAKLMGGVRRQNQVFALFNNFTEAIEAQADALFSLGKSKDAIEILTDTMQLRIKKLQGSWGQFVDAVADTKPLKQAAGALTEIIESLTLAVNPDAFKQNTLIEELTKRQNEALEKVAFAENLLKAKKRALELRDSLKEGRISLEEANIEAQIFAERINRAGREVDFSLGDTDTLDQFVSELQRKQIEIRKIAATQSTNALREGLRQDLVNVASEIRSVVKAQTDKFNMANLVTPGFGDLLNRISLGVSPQEIRGIVDSLEFKGTIEELNQLKSSFKDILSPEEFSAFDQLLNKFENIGQQISRVDDNSQKAAKSFDEMAKRGNQIEIKNLITPESIQRDLDELQQAIAGTNLNDLEVTRKKLSILEKYESVLNETQTNLLKNLRIQEKQLAVEERKTEAVTRQRVALNQLKNRGATDLQILIQELAFLEQIAAKEDEIRQKRAQIAVERQNVEKNAVDSIIDAQLDLLKIQGQSELQLIKSRMELEKRLGIERKGLDALKQQLDLAKAIANENKKSREDRLAELRQAIIDKRKSESPSRQARLDSRENRLVFEAKFAGFSQEEIDKILRPTEGIESQLPSSLESLTKQNDTLGINMVDLTNAVETLTDAVLREESARLDLTSVLSTLKTNIQPEQSVQPINPKLAEPLPSVTRGQTIGSGQNKLVEINVGNTQVYFNQDIERSQIEKFVKESLDEDNERRKNQIVSEIARQMRTPNSDIYKADKENFERF